MKPTLLGLAFSTLVPSPTCFSSLLAVKFGFFPNIHTSPSQPWAFPPAAPAWDALPPHFSSKLQFPSSGSPPDFPAEDIISVLHSYRPWAQELPSLCHRGWLHGDVLTLTATKTGWSTARRLLRVWVGGEHPDQRWGDGDTDTEDQVWGDIFGLVDKIDKGLGKGAFQNNRWLRVHLQCSRPRVRCLGREDDLKKEMPTPVCSLRIPWIEEPDGLQSMGS